MCVGGGGLHGYRPVCVCLLTINQTVGSEQNISETGTEVDAEAADVFCVSELWAVQVSLTSCDTCVTPCFVCV